jgi:hypothetical protein
MTNIIGGFPDPRRDKRWVKAYGNIVGIISLAIEQATPRCPRLRPDTKRGRCAAMAPEEYASETSMELSKALAIGMI